MSAEQILARVIEAVQAAIQGERPQLQRRVSEAIRQAQMSHTGGLGE